MSYDPTCKVWRRSYKTNVETYPAEGAWRRGLSPWEEHDPPSHELGLELRLGVVDARGAGDVPLVMPRGGRSVWPRKYWYAVEPEGLEGDEIEVPHARGMCPASASQNPKSSYWRQACSREPMREMVRQLQRKVDEGHPLDRKREDYALDDEFEDVEDYEEYYGLQPAYVTYPEGVKVRIEADGPWECVEYGE